MPLYSCSVVCPWGTALYTCNSKGVLRLQHFMLVWKGALNEQHWMYVAKGVIRSHHCIYVVQCALEERYCTPVVKAALRLQHWMHVQYSTPVVKAALRLQHWMHKWSETRSQLGQLSSYIFFVGTVCINKDGRRPRATHSLIARQGLATASSAKSIIKLE